MVTIFEYVELNDKTFKEKEFNEIDNLIFSRFAYMELDDIFKENEKVSISELYNRALKIEKFVNIDHFFVKATFELFGLLAKSGRFKDILVGNYVSDIDRTIEKQFAAMTFYLPNNYIYVAYRGTDDNIVAWKEDFNMSYTMHVPSQIESVKYLENVTEKNRYKIIVGGHSKGGNMAMYASVFCKKKIKKRIVKIYNNDGPGFFDEILDTKEYYEMVDKMHTLIPQTSIIGMLLFHRERVDVVKSDRMLIMQHDPDFWYVDFERDSFVKLNEVSKQCRYIDDVMDELLLMPKEDKKRFFDILYQMLTSTGCKTLTDLSSEKIKNIRGILSNYKKLNIEDRELFVKVWKKIITIAKMNISNYLPNKTKNDNRRKKKQAV